MGSRIAPQVVTASSLRASQPSKKSVIEARTKAMKAQRSRANCVSGVSRAPMNGTPPAAEARQKKLATPARTRKPVRALGMCLTT